MDQINKNLMQDSSLTYHYKGDPNIQIGVLGMIDDTLSISKCWNPKVDFVKYKKCCFAYRKEQKV
jgi:hypothetical protein